MSFNCVCCCCLQTVFEMNTQQKSVQYEVMKNKRAAHGEIIKLYQKKVAEIQRETEEGFVENVSDRILTDMKTIFVCI